MLTIFCWYIDDAKTSADLNTYLVQFVVTMITGVCGPQGRCMLKSDIRTVRKFVRS